MLATRATLRDFRNYERAELPLAPGLTVVTGPNGAGKTNLLEAVYFGCTARSPRTSNERELIRHGGEAARVELETLGRDGGHLVEVALDSSAKRVLVDGAAPDRLVPPPAARPLVSVFLPERLELVKGAPAARRAHLDAFVTALWPARGETRAAYSRALAQRNALLARIRAGAATADSLGAWDRELAECGLALMADRAEASDRLVEPFARLGEELGLPATAALRYRPRSAADTAPELEAELAERRQADLDRGFTAHGPHRDEVVLEHDGRRLRAFGSQGQQRVALLALLFAERTVLAEELGTPPLMLLDDVMSELDGSRRELLADLLGRDGQALVTTTDSAHVPGDAAARVEVEAGDLAVIA